MSKALTNSETGEKWNISVAHGEKARWRLRNKNDACM